MNRLTPTISTAGTPYWVELAFDWLASPHPTFGFHLLQIGLAIHPDSLGDSDPAPASFANGPSVGDTMGFMLYDNSAGAHSTERKLQNAEVWLAPTRLEQPVTSPFGLTTGLAFRPSISAGPTRSSATFGEDLPAWPLFKQSSSSTDGLPPTFELTRPGRFYLSARVEIACGSERRTFRVDPEMIVSNTGSGGGP